LTNIKSGSLFGPTQNEALTAGPSTSLRFGWDDNFAAKWGLSREIIDCKMNCHPDRSDRNLQDAGDLALFHLFDVARQNHFQQWRRQPIIIGLFQLPTVIGRVEISQR
jgi:hypothetical protein